MASRSELGIDESMISLTTKGGTSASKAAARIANKKSVIIRRYGRANCHTRA